MNKEARRTAMLRMGIRVSRIKLMLLHAQRFQYDKGITARDAIARDREISELENVYKAIQSYLNAPI